MEESQETRSSAFRPMANALFRTLWIATVVSNIGTWMQEVGAAWLMISLAPTPIMVALVQSAASLPVFLLVLPAGALADVLDRRKLLIVTQAWMLVSAATLGLLTLGGLTTPWVLLLLTAVLSIGSAMNAPAWGAITPDIVPRAEMPAAVALGSVGFNIARVVGPALGGAVLAALGPAYVFLLNAMSFLGVIIVLYRWRRPQRESVLPKERMMSAIRAGGRYVRHAPLLQSVLVRTFVFMVGGSALWALLPIFASQELGLNAAGYGTLLGALGLGAIVGAVVLPGVRRKTSLDLAVRGATVIFAAAALAYAFVRNYTLLLGVMFAAGGAWMTIMSTFSLQAQMTVPGWVRARAIAFYTIMFSAGMAMGSALWGWVATHHGVSFAFGAASATMALGILATIRFPLREAPELVTTTSQHMPLTRELTELDPDQGPVLVLIEYEIGIARVPEFVSVMHELGVARRRDGATHWGIFNNASESGKYVETFVVESWAEHVRQHSRVTLADKQAQDLARSFHLPTEPPKVTHFIYARIRPGEH